MSIQTQVDTNGQSYIFLLIIQFLCLWNNTTKILLTWWCVHVFGLWWSDIFSVLKIYVQINVRNVQKISVRFVSSKAIQSCACVMTGFCCVYIIVNFFSTINYFIFPQRIKSDFYQSIDCCIFAANAWRIQRMDKNILFCQYNKFILFINICNSICFFWDIWKEQNTQNL